MDATRLQKQNECSMNLNEQVFGNWPRSIPTQTRLETYMIGDHRHRRIFLRLGPMAPLSIPKRLFAELQT